MNRAPIFNLRSQLEVLVELCLHSKHPLPDISCPGYADLKKRNADILEIMQKANHMFSADFTDEEVPIALAQVEAWRAKVLRM